MEWLYSELVINYEPLETGNHFSYFCNLLGVRKIKLWPNDWPLENSVNLMLKLLEFPLSQAH